MEIPLSQIFIMSHEDVKDFNARNWLMTQDFLVLDQIVKSADIFFESESNESDLCFEAIDYITLCNLIGEKENGGCLSPDMIKDCIIGLNILCSYEKLRRVNLVKWSGTGRLIDFNKKETEIILTEMGKIVGGSIRTVLQLEESIK